MKQNFIILFLLLTFSSFVCQDEIALENKIGSKKQNLKIMTYNIHHCNPPESTDGKIDVEAIAKVINNAKPDFVALQEVDVNTIRSGKGLNQAKQLAELTGMKFYFSKAIDHEGGDYGVAVLSRFPILDSTRFALPIHADQVEEMRTVAAVTVNLPTGQKVIFASTHLGLKELNRLLQAQTIMNHFGKENLPIILAGDFNAKPESKVIAYFDQYFTRTCKENCPPTIPVDKPAETIDFIMYKPSGHFKVINHKVIDERYASDHLPVVAELVLDK